LLLLKVHQLSIRIKSRLTCRSKLLSIRTRCPTDCALAPAGSVPVPCWSELPPVVSTTQLVGRPFVKRFALCRKIVVCPVCDVVVLWPNGWMDQAATWYGGRPRPRRHCVRWAPSSATERGTAAPSFRPMSIVTKRSSISATAVLLLAFLSQQKRCQPYVNGRCTVGVARDERPRDQYLNVPVATGCR